MQPDPVRVAETRDWLIKAAYDRRAAEFEFTAEPPLTADIVFHCQQLAEKSLKGFLAWHDLPFRNTHSLLELGQQCLEIDSSLESTARPAAALSEYAWKYRYPGEPGLPPLVEAQEALELALALYDAILQRLPAEARP